MHRSCDIATQSTRVRCAVRPSLPNPAKQQTERFALALLSLDMTNVSSEWNSIYGRWVRIDLLYNFGGSGKIKFHVKG
jgi:ribonuclease PH